MAELIYATQIPLITLERYRVTPDDGLLSAAWDELLEWGDPGNGDFRSGFLLGVQDGARTHPACITLADFLHAELVGQFEREHAVRFSLSFYKAAEGRPPVAAEGPFYEGHHLDTHPGLAGSTELLRLLVNLSEHPRRFLYAACDRWMLAERDVSYGRRELETLTLPPAIEQRSVLLPGRTLTQLHALRFLASAVPHVGRNEAPGHFLVSFEALVDVQVPASV